MEVQNTKRAIRKEMIGREREKEREPLFNEDRSAARTARKGDETLFDKMSWEQMGTGTIQCK